MDKVINEAFTRYFNTLSKFGYIKYSESYKVLVLTFIYELLESNCKSFITEDDYKVIDNALYCLYGSTCLIPYPEYIANTSISCTGKSI